MKAVRWGDSRVHLICSLSLRDHCSLLHDVWGLKNHCLIILSVFLVVSDELGSH